MNDNHENLPHSQYVQRLTKWILIDEYSFGMSYLVSYQGISHHDSEDLIHVAYMQCSKPGAARIRKFHRPALKAILRHVTLDFIREWDTEKRRFEKLALCLHELEDWMVETVEAADARAVTSDDWRFVEFLLESVKTKLSPQETLVGEKWIQLVAQGCSDRNELPHAFSPEEREFLMEERKHTWKGFRQFVQRTRRKIETQIKSLGKSQDGYWLN